MTTGSTHEVTAVSSDPRAEALVRDYLGRLQSAVLGSPLTPERRAELMAEVSDHITDALGALPETDTPGGAPTEAAVRNVLDRLGAPEAIVAAEVSPEGSPWQVPTTGYPPYGGRRPGPTAFQRVRDPLALFLLLFGGFFFGVGWLVGGAFLFVSPSWRLRDKLLGVLVWPFGYAGLGIFATVAARTSTSSGFCTSTSTATPPAPDVASTSVAETCTTSSSGGLPPWVGFLITVIVLVAPLVMAAWLWRTRRVVPEEQPA